MSTTNIEWADRVWNPVTGCTKVSQGCKNCYAEGVAARFFAHQYPQVAAGPTLPDGGPTAWRPRLFTDVQTHADRLKEPLGWRKPARVFVNSMSDLFHEDVPDEFLDHVFAVMALADQHMFLVLTKRPERMRAYFADEETHERIEEQLWARHTDNTTNSLPYDGIIRNVWLGVSVEDQATADARIPLLLNTPAAIRFVSAEPLLAHVDLRRYLRANHAVREHVSQGKVVIRNETGVDWLIVGGESGHGARRLELQWARDLVDQVRATMGGTTLFVKQLGSAPVDVARPTSITQEERRQWRADGWCNVVTNDGEFFTKHPRLKDRKGGDPAEWPEDLRVREFPSQVPA